MSIFPIIPCSWTLIITCLFVGFNLGPSTISAYIETVVVSGCENCSLHLTCRHFASVMAILEADFIETESKEVTPTDEDCNNNSSTTTIAPTPFPRFHPRQALNQRCSGVHHCSFILVEDCPGASTWGPGNITVTYVCISEDRIRPFCSSEIVLPETQTSGISQGFIHNPGYPRFYSSERECRWKITAPPQQHVRVRILDISVTADRMIYPGDCGDRVDIIESGQVVHSTCEPQEPPWEFTTAADSVEVVLASTHSLIPLRGVLVHYSAVGCPTPAAPEDGYLVYRNDTAAEFRCCVGFAFPAGQKSRLLVCTGAFWNDTLPRQCSRITSVPVAVVDDGQPVKVKTEMASDLIAPALLILALFLINFVVLYYIYKIKQKHLIEISDEELGTLRQLPLKTDTTNGDNAAS